MRKIISMAKIVPVVIIFLLSACTTTSIRTSPEYNLTGGKQASSALKGKTVKIHALNEQRETTPEYFVLKQSLADHLTNNLGMIAHSDIAEQSDYIAIFDFESDWHADGLEKSYYLSLMSVEDGIVLRRPEAVFFRLTSINMELNVTKEGEKLLDQFFNALESSNSIAIIK